MNQPTRYLILLCIAFILTNCRNKCPEKKDIYVYINEQEKACLPYTGEETLIFFREPQNDTQSFYGQGIKPHQIFQGGGGAGACPNDDYVKEGRSIFFQNAMGQDGIILKQEATGSSPGSPGSDVHIQYAGFGFIESTSLVNSSFAKDSISVNSLIYRNLVVFGRKNYGNTSKVPLNNRCYLNKTEGLVRVIIPTGTTLTLINRN